MTYKFNPLLPKFGSALKPVKEEGTAMQRLSAKLKFQREYIEPHLGNLTPSTDILALYSLALSMLAQVTVFIVIALMTTMPLALFWQESNMKKSPYLGLFLFRGL